jgi:hypothetical protein
VILSVPGEVLKTPIILRSVSSMLSAVSQKSLLVPFQSLKGLCSRSSAVSKRSSTSRYNSLAFSFVSSIVWSPIISRRDLKLGESLCHLTTLYRSLLSFTKLITCFQYSRFARYTVDKKCRVSDAKPCEVLLSRCL